MRPKNLQSLLNRIVPENEIQSPYLRELPSVPTSLEKQESNNLSEHKDMKLTIRATHIKKLSPNISPTNGARKPHISPRRFQNQIAA